MILRETTRMPETSQSAMDILRVVRLSQGEHRVKMPASCRDKSIYPHISHVERE